MFFYCKIVITVKFSIRFHGIRFSNALIKYLKQTQNFLTLRKKKINVKFYKQQIWGNPIAKLLNFYFLHNEINKSYIQSV